MLGREKAEELFASIPAEAQPPAAAAGEALPEPGTTPAAQQASLQAAQERILSAVQLPGARAPGQPVSQSRPEQGAPVQLTIRSNPSLASVALARRQAPLSQPASSEAASAAGSGKESSAQLSGRDVAEPEQAGREAAAADREDGAASSSSSSSRGSQEDRADAG